MVTRQGRRLTGWTDVTGIVKHEPPCDENGEIILEICGGEGVVMLPPSMHPSGAHHEFWSKPGEPATCSADDLLRAADHVAAAAIIARRWTKGQRHNLALAVAGVLLKAGLPGGETEAFVTPIAEVTGEDEVVDRRRAVVDTHTRRSAPSSPAAPSQSSSVTTPPSSCGLRSCAQQM